MNDVTSFAELQDLIRSGGNVVVDFQALAWCVPCQRFAPHFDKAADQVTDATFVTVDIDRFPEAVIHFGIQSVPTVRLFTDGQPVADLRERTVVKFVHELNNLLGE